MKSFSVTLLAMLLATCALTGCGGGTTPASTTGSATGSGSTSSNGGSPPPVTYVGILPNAPSPQITPTYDGSGKVVEPSIHVFDSPWHGFTHWLIVSPYPNSNALLENPSVLVSNDGKSWSVPPGLTNPVALPAKGAHLDDASLYYDSASDQLWIYFLADDTQEHLFRTTSSDGVTWSAPQELLKGSGYWISSPSVERGISTNYGLWTVNLGSNSCTNTPSKIEYRSSADGVTWSAAQATNAVQPGYIPWHVTVNYIPSKSEYWMLLAAYAANSDCGKTQLFFQKSTDGINWVSYNHVALGIAQLGRWDDSMIYRSTLHYTPATDLLEVWYNGRQDIDYRVGYTSMNYTTFLSKMQQ